MEVPLGFGKSFDIGGWTYGLLNEFIRHGANAVVGGVVISADDPGGDYPFLGANFFLLILKVFVASGLLLGVMPYLAAHSLPERIRKKETEVVERTPHTSKVITGTGDGTVSEPATQTIERSAHATKITKTIETEGPAVVKTEDPPKQD